MLYSKVAQATIVKPHALIRETLSPKLRRVAAMEPRIMLNSSQERKVRSAAK
jgi:hypothetical protein